MMVTLKELLQKNKSHNKESVSFRCDTEVLNLLKHYSKEHNISLSYLINDICTEWSVKYES